MAALICHTHTAVAAGRRHHFDPFEAMSWLWVLGALCGLSGDAAQHSGLRIHCLPKGHQMLNIKPIIDPAR